MAWLTHDPLTRFLVQIVVITAACRGLGLIARRIGQPVVIAEVAAGIVLGPSVLGWIAPGVAQGLFPAGSLGVVRLVSQLGLVLFMFLVGLELDVRLLRGRARSSILISQTSIAVPFALGCALATVLHAGFSPPGMSPVAFALFLGAAMSITAFPVLARILGERGLLRTRVGSMTIACAAIDDVTAWCLLAFAVGVARARGVAGALVTSSLAAAYVAAMLLGVRPLLARLAARVGSPGAMSQNLVAAILLLALVSSWITERIGIHVLFGAFLFGVALPKEGGLARAMAEKLEDVVVVLLLPLFFAVSGLRTEIGLLGTTHHLLVCAAIVGVASLGKFGGAALAARFGGTSWREASAIGVLMNTRGLMELIVLNIGLDLGVITPALFSMMVIMALLTTFVSTPLLARIYPPSLMARDLLEDEEPPPARPSISRLMVCIAHPAAGPALVSMARALASPRSEVVALHLAAAGAERSDEAGDVLAPALERGRELGMSLRPLSFVSTDPAGDIARVADVRDVDVALLGLRTPVALEGFLGGVVHDVLRETHAAVAIFVDRQRAAFRRVLVPFEGAPQDEVALALATRVQQSCGGEVTLLHVVGPSYRMSRSRRVIDSFLATDGRVIVETVEHRSAAEAAIERAADFDLVIAGIGAEPGHGFGRHPERLIRDCPTSLLLVRGPRAPADAVAEPDRPPVQAASE